MELSDEQKGVVQLALAISIILKRAGKKTLQARARGSKRESCSSSTVSGSLLDCDGDSATVDRCDGGLKAALNNAVVATPDLMFRLHQIRDAVRSVENVDLASIERIARVMLLEALRTGSEKCHFSEVLEVLIEIASSSETLHVSVTKAFLDCLPVLSEELHEGGSDVNMVHTRENGALYFDCLEALLQKITNTGGFAKGHCNDVWKTLSTAMLKLTSCPLEQSRVWLIYHVLMSE